MKKEISFYPTHGTTPSACFLTKFFICMAFLSVFFFPCHLFAATNNTNIAEHKAGFYYTIQKGDTLWGLSQRFSDSPWLWPDLWKENDEIANPHWIYPGNRIRLYRKDWTGRFDTPVEMAPFSHGMPTLIHYLHNDMERVGFVRKEAVPPSAVIFKVTDEKELISEGDLVFLRKESPSGFMPGSQYTVYRTSNPIKDKKTGELIGIQHYLTGIVEIVKEEADFATGKVVKSFRAIYLNDKLMPHIKRSQEIPIRPNTKQISGSVIRAEEEKTMAGDHEIVFIDRGENDGVRLGQFFNIYHQEDARIEDGGKNKVLLDAQVFGELMIIHTEATTATALITRSKDPITSGARINSLTE